MKELQTVRVFLMTGGYVDVLCSGMRTEGSAYLFQGNALVEAGKDPETVAKFHQAAVAGFVVIDTQPHMASRVSPV